MYLSVYEFNLITSDYSETMVMKNTILADKLADLF
jgi:hypothetical protein